MAPVHYQPGPDGAASQDEVDYLRSENLRLNRANVKLTGEVRTVHGLLLIEQTDTAKRVTRDLEVRRLRLDNMHLNDRIRDLMARLARGTP